MTLWSGRFDTAPDPAAFDFGISFGFDRALFEDDVTGSLAWAEALGAAGVLAKQDAAAIRKGLEEMLEEGRRDPAYVNGPDEDVHSFVERKLVERIGDAGRRLHTGRSRNEQVSLDLRLYLRRRIPVLQQAVARLGAAAEEADALPLGSGAIAGTSYPIDTNALARALGFSRVVANSMDASSDRDFVAAFLCAASIAMVHLSRIAEDFIIFTGEEHGFFELADVSATGSSMMPQKKNPDPLELVRGKTGRT